MNTDSYLHELPEVTNVMERVDRIDGRAIFDIFGEVG